MLFLNSLFYFVIIINILIGFKDSSSFVNGSEDTVSSDSICDKCKTMKCNDIPKDSINSKICCEICLNEGNNNNNNNINNKNSNNNNNHNNNNNESFNVDNKPTRPIYIPSHCRNINCSSIVYSYSECPSDSEIVPTTFSEKICCSDIEYKCVCKKCEDPIDQCKGLNSDKKLISKGENIPNKCCDKYTCQMQNFSCNYNGKFHIEGSEWNPTKCKTCKCERSIAKCTEKKCPKLDCKITIVPESDCCPICRTECYSSNGTLYRDKERWLEDDDCAECICNEGQKICSIEHCRQTLCVNPIKVPGVCCKYCPENEVQQVRYPPHCSNNAHNLRCNLTCKNNAIKLNNRCPICECAPSPIEKCSFPCDKGLAYMPLNDRLCECTNQCQTKCSIICTNGYQKGPDGCDICKCNDIPKSQPGHLCHHDHENAKGNIWFDGCRQCFCHNRKQYCSLISCNINCKNPIYIKKSCCPICSEDIHVRQSNESINSIKCHFSSTKKSDSSCSENETWSLDKHTKCMCREGIAYCEVSVCTAGTCPVPNYDQDDQSCCLTCNADQFLNSTLNVLLNKTLITPAEIATWDCYDSYDHRKPHGARWKENDCLHCVCDNGDRKCYQEKCDYDKNCKQLAFKKGQCCPYCIDYLNSTCMLKIQLFDNITTIITSTLKPSTTNLTTIVLIILVFVIVCLTIIVILLICYIINKHNENNSSTCHLTSSTIIAKNMMNGSKKFQWQNEEDDDLFEHSNKSPKYYKKNSFDLNHAHHHHHNNNNHINTNNYNHLKQQTETKIKENGTIATTKLLNGGPSLHSLNKPNNGNIIVYV